MFLCRTCKPGETITVTTPSGETVEVTFIRKKGQSASIGLNAPEGFAFTPPAAKLASDAE